MANRKYTTLPYTEYTVANGRYDAVRSPIDRIVLHTMVGTVQSTRNLFATFPAPGKETSAHYGIGYDGKIDAYLEEYYTAYHCGNYAFNQRSIGIEHEDKGQYNSPRPDALYETSAKLVADICKFYNIPCDSTHIVRHQNVQGASTACPDSLDTNRIINSALQILAGNPPMNPNITKKASFFDRIWHAYKGDNVNTDIVSDQEVTDYINYVKSNVNRAGKWDSIVLKSNNTGDSNIATVDGTFERIKAMGSNTAADRKKAINDCIDALKKVV